MLKTARTKRAKPRLQLVALSFALSALLQSLPVNASLDRVSDFALIDAKGEFHQLSRYKHRDALVLLTYDPSCSSAAQIQRFANLQAQFNDSNISFGLLDTSGATRAELIALSGSLPDTLPLLQDGPKLVASLLGASRANEVLVLNPDRLNVFYRGGHW